MCKFGGTELMGLSGRIYSGLLICVFVGSCMFILGGLAYLIPDWSLLMLVCNTPFVLLFSLWW